MIFKNLILVLFILFSNRLYCQIYGCTDTYANNYNSNATINDGSCLYDPVNYAPIVLVNGISDTVNENSGLIYFNNALWTHNDGVAGNKLYKLDAVTGTTLQTITINDTSIIDLEDIDHDNDFLYVGDFGNNSGDRHDLKILKIKKTDIPQLGDTSVNVTGIIEFNFPDQTDFTNEKFAHDFDCEALICINDKIYLFSKNWINRKTRLYSVPAIEGNYSATLIDSFDVNGMITGAAYNSKNKSICLIGHDTQNTFAWMLYDYLVPNLLSGNKRRIDLTGMFEYQTEAIAYYQNDEFYISNEMNTASAANLYEFSTVQWITSSRMNTMYSQNEFIFPNPSDGHIYLTNNTKSYLEKINVLDITGKIVYQKNFTINNTQDYIPIDLFFLKKGIYFLEIFSQNNKTINKKVIII